MGSTAPVMRRARFVRTRENVLDALEAVSFGEQPRGQIHRGSAARDDWQYEMRCEVAVVHDGLHRGDHLRIGEQVHVGSGTSMGMGKIHVTEVIR